MGIQINGATDSITAIDGTIDVVSAIGNAGVVTATAFVGNITGNVTGNINHTSALELQTGGVTRAHFNSSGHFGIAGISTFSDDVKFTGANYNVLWDKSDNSLKFDALAKIKLNDSFQFYHNTNGVIHNTAGITFIYGSGSGNISIQAQSGAQNISCAPNGGTSLYYQGSQKFYTVSDGVYINDNLGIQDSIQHILDTDTKIRFPSNDTISFETGGSERLRIDSSGRVLIATTSGSQGQVSIKNANDFSTASVSTNTDNIFLISDATSGDGVYGASIGFSRVQYPDRRAAAIATVQEGSDEDNVGLAFFTHPAANATDPIVEALRITSGGHLKIPDNAEIRIGNAQTGDGDMKFYHNGSNSFIQHLGTGGLYIDALNNSADIAFRSQDNINFYTNAASQSSIACVGNGGVILYNQGNARFNVDNDGAVVTEKRLAINRNAGDPYLQFQTSGTTHATLYGGSSTGFRVFTGSSQTERLRIKSDGKVVIGNTNGSGTGALTIYPNSITGNGRLDVYGGGDENAQTQSKCEVMRIGRGDILDQYYHSIWSATGSGGSNSHFLKFYTSNGNAGATNQKEALSMNGEGYVTKVSQPRALVKIYGNTTISNGKVDNWATPIFNVGSLWDTTNKRFVAPTAGLYLIGGNFRIGAPGKIRVVRFEIRAYNSSNGHMATYGGGFGGTHNYDGGSGGYDHPYVSFTNAIYLTTGQYLELHCSENAVEHTSYIQVNNDQSHMWCVLLQ